MSKSRDKGTRAETAVVAYLRDHGFGSAERRALNGAHDRGDITGIPALVAEVKNCARTELACWVDEARDEQANDDGAAYAVVWHKRRGTTDPGKWFVTMDGETFTRLLADSLETEDR